MEESIGSQKEAQRSQENVNFFGEDFEMDFPPNRILSCVLGKTLVLFLKGFPPERAIQRYVKEIFLLKGWYVSCTIDDCFGIDWGLAELF